MPQHLYHSFSHYHGWNIDQSGNQELHLQLLESISAITPTALVGPSTHLEQAWLYFSECEHISHFCSASTKWLVATTLAPPVFPQYPNKTP